VLEAEAMELGDVKELAGSAVRLSGVPRYVAFVANYALDGFGQLFNGDVFARADVYYLCFIIGLHQVEAGRGQVVDVEKLAHGGAAAPEGDAWGAGCFGFVKAADEGRQDVGGGEVEVVVRAIKVGRHDADEIAPVLAAVALAHEDAGNLGYRVGVVAGFKRPGE